MPLWSERRLIRLWHIMNEFRAVQFWWLSQELLRLERDLSDSVDKAWVLDLEARMTCAEDQCKTIALGEVAILPLYNIKTELHRFELTLNYPIEVESIKRELRAFRQNIEIELGKRRFAYIPQERARYFESEQPFGKEVYDAFPSIRFDLKRSRKFFGLRNEYCGSISLHESSRSRIVGIGKGSSDTTRRRDRVYGLGKYHQGIRESSGSHSAVEEFCH